MVKSNPCWSHNYDQSMIVCWIPVGLPVFIRKFSINVPTCSHARNVSARFSQWWCQSESPTIAFWNFWAFLAFFLLPSSTCVRQGTGLLEQMTCSTIGSLRLLWAAWCTLEKFTNTNGRRNDLLKGVKLLQFCSPAPKNIRWWCEFKGYQVRICNTCNTCVTCNNLE